MTNPIKTKMLIKMYGSPENAAATELVIRIRNGKDWAEELVNLFIEYDVSTDKISEQFFKNEGLTPGEFSRAIA
jgi:hypothetical protein